jgi:hypothetical protein
VFRHQRWCSPASRFVLLTRFLFLFSLAKILSQIEGSSGDRPVEILAQAKGKEPANDALPRFFAVYASKKRVGTLQKEVHRGKLIDEWKKLLAGAAEKPVLVDMAPALSAFMAVKDADELVRLFYPQCTNKWPHFLSEMPSNCGCHHLHATQALRDRQIGVNLGQRVQDISRDA